MPQRRNIPVLACLIASALSLLPAPAFTQSRDAPPRAALTFEVELPSAPYHVPSAPNVSVHVPAGFDAASPLSLVVYLHGLRGCLPVLMGEGSTRCDAGSAPQLGWNLGAHHDAAGTNTVFVVPRLYYDKRGGQPGAFGKPGGFRAFLSELLSGPLSTRLGRRYTRESIASITLVAHSAGYETTIAILERGEVDGLVRAVVLFDALYAFQERYARYAIAHADRGLHLIAVHFRGKPARNGKELHKRLLRALGAERVASSNARELKAAVAQRPFVFAQGRGPHAQVPQHHLAEVLAALGLPMRVTSR
jgi:hypothetical protein